MEQVLAIAQDITTLLLPLFLIGCFRVIVLIIRLLYVVNKTAWAVKETTFMVNSVVQSSLSGAVGFVSSLFEGKGK
jgi:hypothetical protein